MTVQDENIRQDPLRTLPATLEQRWSADIRTLYRTSMRRFSDLDLERSWEGYYVLLLWVFPSPNAKKKNVAQHVSQQSTSPCPLGVSAVPLALWTSSIPTSCRSVLCTSYVFEREPIELSRRRHFLGACRIWYTVLFRCTDTILVAEQCVLGIHV